MRCHTCRGKTDYSSRFIKIKEPVCALGRGKDVLDLNLDQVQVQGHVEVKDQVQSYGLGESVCLRNIAVVF